MLIIFSISFLLIIISIFIIIVKVTFLNYEINS